jgi:hypothetical protein
VSRIYLNGPLTNSGSGYISFWYTNVFHIFSPQFRHRGHSLMTSRSKREKVIYLVTTSLTKALNVLTMGVRVSKIGQNCVTSFTPKCTYVSILYVNIHARAPESLFCLLFHFPQLSFFLHCHLFSFKAHSVVNLFLQPFKSH